MDPACLLWVARFVFPKDYGCHWSIGARNSLPRVPSATAVAWFISVCRAGVLSRRVLLRGPMPPSSGYGRLVGLLLPHLDVIIPNDRPYISRGFLISRRQFVATSSHGAEMMPHETSKPRSQMKHQSGSCSKLQMTFGSPRLFRDTFVFSALLELAAVDQRPSGAGPGAAGKHRSPSTQRGQYFIIRHHGDRLLSHLADAWIEK
ncbi:unnamed protein product [Boreogadus saida]